MTFVVRALGIGLAASVAYLLMTAFDDGEGGANIGAGLAVFAVLAIVGFGWGMRDGLNAEGHRGLGPGLGRLLLRWLVVSILAVAVLVASMVIRQGTDYLSDLDVSTALFLGLLVFVPSVVGLLIGYAVRSGAVEPSPRA